MIISFFIIDKGLPVPASTLIKEVQSRGWGGGGAALLEKENRFLGRKD